MLLRFVCWSGEDLSRGGLRCFLFAREPTCGAYITQCTGVATTDSPETHLPRVRLLRKQTVLGLAPFTGINACAGKLPRCRGLQAESACRKIGDIGTHTKLGRRGCSQQRACLLHLSQPLSPKHVAGGLCSVSNCCEACIGLANSGVGTLRGVETV